LEKIKEPLLLLLPLGRLRTILDVSQLHPQAKLLGLRQGLLWERGGRGWGSEMVKVVKKVFKRIVKTKMADGTISVKEVKITDPKEIAAILAKKSADEAAAAAATAASAAAAAAADAAEATGGAGRQGRGRGEGMRAGGGPAGAAGKASQARPISLKIKGSASSCGGWGRGGGGGGSVGGREEAYGEAQGGGCPHREEGHGSREQVEHGVRGLRGVGHMRTNRKCPMFKEEGGGVRGGGVEEGGLVERQEDQADHQDEQAAGQRPGTARWRRGHREVGRERGRRGARGRGMWVGRRGRRRLGTEKGRTMRMLRWRSLRSKKEKRTRKR